MRIAWVTPGPLHQRTGGYVYDRIVVEGLRSRGHEVQSYEADMLGRSLRASLTTAAVDVVVFDELAHAAFLRSRVWLDRRPSLLLVHHLGAWEPERSAVERAALLASEIFALTRASSVVAASPFVAERLRTCRVFADAIIAPGADRLPRAPYERAADAALRVLFVGSIVPRKRVLALLDAVEKCSLHSFIRLEIVGEPRDEAYARAVRHRVARSHVLARSVTMSGLVTDESLAHAFARSDLLVLPSSLEGFGIVLAEALYAGIPVLASNSGGARHAVRFAEGAAMLVPPSAIEEALLAIASRPDVRARLSRAASAARASAPTWTTAIDAFEGALMRAAQASEPKRARAR